MQVYVQKLTTTTFPRRPVVLSGGEFTHSRALPSEGILPWTSNGGASTAVPFSSARLTRAVPAVVASSSKIRQRRAFILTSFLCNFRLILSLSTKINVQASGGRQPPGGINRHGCCKAILCVHLVGVWPQGEIPSRPATITQKFRRCGDGIAPMTSPQPSGAGGLVVSHQFTKRRCRTSLAPWVFGSRPRC